MSSPITGNEPAMNNKKMQKKQQKYVLSFMSLILILSTIQYYCDHIFSTVLMFLQ